MHIKFGIAKIKLTSLSYYVVDYIYVLLWGPKELNWWLGNEMKWKCMIESVAVDISSAVAILWLQA